MKFVDLKDFAPKFIKTSNEALKAQRISREEYSIASSSLFQNLAMITTHPTSACCGTWKETDVRFIRAQSREAVFIEEINKLKDNQVLISIFKKIFQTDLIEFSNANVTI